MKKRRRSKKTMKMRAPFMEIARQIILPRLALGLQRLTDMSPAHKYLERQDHHQDLDEEQPLEQPAPEGEIKGTVGNQPGKNSEAHKDE